MEYIGTIFVALICFWLGYVLGKIKKQQQSYDDGYLQGHFNALYEEQKDDYPMPEDTVLFNKGVEEGRRLEKEEQTRLPVSPDKWETPLG